jgi:DNA-binding transcriptional ArsR family regulator
MTTIPKQLQFVRQVQVPPDGGAEPVSLPIASPTTRERLVAALAERPRTVAQLAGEFGLSQPTTLEQVRRALRDGLIVEVEVPREQRRSAGERYYAPAVPVVRRVDRDLLEPACQALAAELADALSKRRGDLVAAFALTHLSRDGWEFSDLWPYLQDILFRLALERADGLVERSPAPPHGLAWIEDLSDNAMRDQDEETEGVA